MYLKCGSLYIYNMYCFKTLKDIFVLVGHYDLDSPCCNTIAVECYWFGCFYNKPILIKSTGQRVYQDTSKISLYNLNRTNSVFKHWLKFTSSLAAVGSSPTWHKLVRQVTLFFSTGCLQVVHLGFSSLPIFFIICATRNEWRYFDEPHNPDIGKEKKYIDIKTQWNMFAQWLTYAAMKML